MSDLIPNHGGYRNLVSFQVSQLVYDITIRFCERYINRFSRTRDQMVQAARSGVQNIAEGSQISATSRKMEIKLTQVARASLEELRLDYQDFLRQNNHPIFPPNHPALVRFKSSRPETTSQFAQWVATERALSKAECHQGDDRDDRDGRDDRDDRDGRDDRDDRDSRDSRDDKDPQFPESPPQKINNPTSLPKGLCQSLSVPEGPCAVPEGPCQSMSSTPTPHKAIPSSCFAANGALALINLACYLLDRQVESLARRFETEGGFTERLYRVRTSNRRSRD